jgi:hypothetical protein
VGTAVAFRVDVSLVVTFSLGVLAAALGVVLLARRGGDVRPWEGFLGAIWVASYVILTLLQINDPDALLTNVALVLVGGGRAVPCPHPAAYLVDRATVAGVGA